MENQGGEPLQVEGDISGIELFFPKLAEAGVKGIAGEIVPFAMPQESRREPEKGKEEARQGSDIKNAEVRITGTELRAFTDAKGSYSFTEAPEVSGISYSVSGSGLYPVVFSSCRRSVNRIPVFSDVQIEKFFEQLALIKIRQEKNRGILIGKIISEKSPEDIYVDLSTLDADGPFYFNVKRELDPGLEFPAENGLFAYFNIPGGLHTVGPRIGDEELPGGVVDVYSGTISYIHIDVGTTLSLRGVVKNAFMEEGKNRVPGATVSLIGAPNRDSVISDEKGYFELKNVRAINNINTIEITAKDFATNRVTGCFSGREVEIYVFPIKDSESYDGIETILRENHLNYDPSMGMVMGSIMRGGSLVLDIPDADRAQIVYFDPGGNIDLSRKSTSPIDGNFLILNVPVGQRNILSYDEKGNIRNYFTIRSGGSIISSVTSY